MVSYSDEPCLETVMGGGGGEEREIRTSSSSLFKNTVNTSYIRLQLNTKLCIQINYKRKVN